MREWRAAGVKTAGVVVIAAGAALLIAIAAAGCESKSSEQPAAAERPDRGTPSAIYTVRGRVESLPDPAKPASDFQVRHEAIDNFVDSSGEVVGMGAMVMPFPLAEGVSIADLKEGDVVEVTFAVWWQPRRHWEATRVEKLPPQTPLEFREARPPQAAPAEAPAGEETPAGGG